MKKFWLALIAVTSMAGLSRPADAQDAGGHFVALSAELTTVVAVVEKEGYSPSRQLLNCVLKESKIKFADVTRLPVGQKVYISEKCTKSASPMSAPQKGQLNKKVAVAEALPENTTKVVVYDSAAIKESARLKQAMGDTTKKLNQQLANAKKLNWVFIASALLTAIMLGVTVTLGIQKYLEKRKVSRRPRPRGGTRAHQMDNDPRPTK